MELSLSIFSSFEGDNAKIVADGSVENHVTPTETEVFVQILESSIRNPKLPKRIGNAGR